MAIYFLRTTSVARSAGRRATAAAAYRAGERLRDERSGLLYNHAHRKDVVHSAIFLPGHLAGAADDWAQRRETLWNAAERAEKQANSRVAREYQVALPHELNTAQQVALARSFARELSERYRVAVDLAVHLPRPDGDPRNFHAHLLTTTREVTPRGLGAKTGLDKNGSERRRRELPSGREELRALRERWGSLANEALREANVAARVDHRSYAERGIDREPQPLIPIGSIKMERRGLRSEVAERIREQYRQRVAARQQRAPEARAPEARPADAEEVRRQAREAWLRLRAGQAAAEPEGARREREPLAHTAQHDDDLAL
ncbi:MAG: MobA/MobL family protein [Gammaproteobacteria bacterium]|nr:MobA/MobL family protein [Gammaproteobacteria bacterium]